MNAETTLRLADLDRLAAVGVMTRAAIALEDETDPAGAYRLPNEAVLREQVLREARAKLGLGPVISAADAERIAELLDDECEVLIGPVDEQAALERMSAQGRLPSDVYSIVISEDVRALYLHRAFDLHLIENAVRRCDGEQHVVANGNAHPRPRLESVFGKRYESRYPLKSFALLVAGVREGLIFRVEQAWRIYADTEVGDTDTLRDMLKRFVDDLGMRDSARYRRYLDAHGWRFERRGDLTLK